MRYHAAFAVGVVLLSWGVAWPDSPTGELRGFFSAASRILDDRNLDGKADERLAATRALAHEMFDFREAARLALGPDWDERTPAEREEFVRLFSDLLERAFIAGIAGRTQIADGVKVTFVGESLDGSVASVRTTMVGKNGHDLPFDYQMVQRGQRWVVRDVAIDGVSLTANYRAQFARVIQASSYPDLVRQMQERCSVPLVATTVSEGPLTRVALASSPAPEMPVKVAEMPVKVSEMPVRVPEMPVKVPDTAQPPPAVVTTPAAEVHRPVTVTREAPRLANGEMPIAPPPPVAATAPALRDPPAPRAGPVIATSARTTNVDASGRRTYWVQVAALKNLEAAMRLASTLQEEKPPVSDRWAVVMEPSREGSALARVRVGPFSDRTAAASSARELEARGYKPFIAEDRH